MSDITFKDAKTTPQAAEFLHLAATTLERWRWEGKGPTYYRIGGKVFYRIEDLLRYAESGQRVAKPVIAAPEVSA